MRTAPCVCPAGGARTPPGPGCRPPTTPAKCWLWGSQQSPKCGSPVGTAPTDSRHWQLGGSWPKRPHCVEGGPESEWADGHFWGPSVYPSWLLCPAKQAPGDLRPAARGRSPPVLGFPKNPDTGSGHGPAQWLRLQPAPAPHRARDQGTSGGAGVPCPLPQGASSLLAGRCFGDGPALADFLLRAVPYSSPFSRQFLSCS